MSEDFLLDFVLIVVFLYLIFAPFDEPL